MNRASKVRSARRLMLVLWGALFVACSTAGKEQTTERSVPGGVPRTSAAPSAPPDMLPPSVPSESINVRAVGQAGALAEQIGAENSTQVQVVGDHNTIRLSANPHIAPQLDRIEEKVTATNDKIDRVATAVHAFQADVTVRVFGEWASGEPLQTPGIMSFGSSSPDVTLVVEDRNGAKREVTLSTMGALPRARKSGVDESTIQYSAGATPGAWPLGASDQDLVRVVSGSLKLFSIGSDSFADRKLGLREVHIRIFVNGVDAALIDTHPNGTIQMPPGAYGSIPIMFAGRFEPFRTAKPPQ